MNYQMKKQSNHEFKSVSSLHNSALRTYENEKRIEHRKKLFAICRNFGQWMLMFVVVLSTCVWIISTICVDEEESSAFTRFFFCRCHSNDFSAHFRSVETTTQTPPACLSVSEHSRLGLARHVSFSSQTNQWYVRKSLEKWIVLWLSIQLQSLDLLCFCLSEAIHKKGL